MQVREIMKKGRGKDLRWVKPNDTLQQAAELMKRADIGSLPVVEGKQGIGFLTDRDLAIRGFAAGLAPSEKVSRVMTKKLVTCPENCSSKEALQLMRSNDVRRLLVVDPHNQPIGIVTLADIAEQAGEPGDILRQTVADLKHHKTH